MIPQPPMLSLFLSLSTAIVLAGMFYFFCFKYQIFQRFGRTALSWPELISLSLVAFIPMIGFFTSMYFSENIIPKDDSYKIVFMNVCIWMIAKQAFDLLSNPFRKLQIFQIE